MIVAWNGHMQKFFVPYWISCLDEYFYEFSKKKANVLINNSYINEKTCGSPSNTREINISHILETEPTHATEYNKIKVFTEKYKLQ